MSAKRLHIIRASLVVLLLLFGGTSAVSEEEKDICQETVLTRQGTVKGMSSREGRSCAYKGIPYAAPPVEELRFRAPQSPSKRENTLNAVEFGAECMQHDDFSWTGGGKPLTETDEDCLYLNIWRPAREGRFPVLVFIHGGRFTKGSGARPAWQGDKLAANHEVVVVTINYRLGPFGFLAHPELEDKDGQSSGNYGLMDQVMALNWIKNNINAFGGDHWRITIAGSGAGASSVCALLTSPKAQGLFHRAILQSGSCRAVRSPEEALRQIEKIVRETGCAGTNIADCLRNQPASKILAATEKPRGLRDWFHFPYLPMVDGEYVTDVPLDLIKRGDYNRVPVLLGSNRNEANFLTLEYPGIRLAPKFTMRGFIKDLLGQDGLYGIDHFYTLSHYRRPADQALHACGDLVYGCPVFEAAEALAEKQKSVYYYSFDYAEHTYSNMVRAPRGFEVPFVFDTLDRVPYNLAYAPHQRENARPLIDVMSGFWARFAATGDPNHPDLPFWTTYEKEKRQRMFLDLPPYAIHTNNVEKCRYWQKHDLIKHLSEEE